MSKDRSISGGTTTGTGAFAAGGRAAAGNRLPTAPRERKPALAALAVLLILAGALSTMLLVTREGNRISVVKMAKTVGAGQKLSADDFTEQQVAADAGMKYVLWSQAGELTGRQTNNTLVQGSVLVEGSLGNASDVNDLKIDAGDTLIGVKVNAGRYPTGQMIRGSKFNLYVATTTQSSGGSGTTNWKQLPGKVQLVDGSGSDTMTLTLAVPDSMVTDILTASDLYLTKTIG